MYYLRKEPYESIGEEVKKTDGTIIAAKKYITDDRAIYKHQRFSRYYRGYFKGVNEKYQGMKVYRCKKLKTILSLRENMFNYCGEWFDVWDENGKVTIIESKGV